MPASALEDQTTALIRAHQTEVWRYLRFLGCQPAEAEDLAQETFLAVFRSNFEDRGPISTSAYLRKVARHLFWKARARAERQPQIHELDAAEEAWGRHCTRDGGSGYLEALGDCVTELDGRSRLAIQQRYGQGLSRSQIAANLEISTDGVKSMLRRLRQILRRCVERQIP